MSRLITSMIFSIAGIVLCSQCHVNQEPTPAAGTVYPVLMENTKMQQEQHPARIVETTRHHLNHGSVRIGALVSCTHLQ